MLVLQALSEMFQLSFLYTPAITYNIDQEKGKWAFLRDLVPQPPDFAYSNLYLSMIQKINNILKFDREGVKLAKSFAFNLIVSLPLLLT